MGIWLYVRSEWQMSEMTIADARFLFFGPTKRADWLQSPKEPRRGYTIRTKEGHSIQCSFFSEGQLYYWYRPSDTGHRIDPSEMVEVTRE
jgi:hypothetical protein